MNREVLSVFLFAGLLLVGAAWRLAGAAGQRGLRADGGGYGGSALTIALHTASTG